MSKQLVCLLNSLRIVAVLVPDSDRDVFLTLFILFYRKIARNLRRVTAPQDPRLRKVWIANLLQESNKELIEDNHDEENLDVFFASLDNDIISSR